MTRPEDFTEFCFRVSALLVLAGLPREARDVAAQRESEALRCVHAAWRDLEAGFPPEDWTHAAPSVLHDAVLDMGAPLAQAKLIEALTERSA